MKKASFISNYFYSMISEVLVLLVPLVTTPYVSRVLNAKTLGDYGFTSGIVSYFGIFAALGTVNYAKRELAYVQKDCEKRSKIFFEILLLRTITTSISLVAYLLFLFFSTSELRFLYIIQIITVISWYLDITWLFGGMEDFKVVSLRNNLVKTLGMMLIFLFVKTENDVWLYTLILSGSLLVGNITAIPYARKYIKKVKINELHIGGHIKGVLVMFASVVAVQLYTVLDQTMLGRLVNTTDVGYYTQAQKIIRVALTIISSFALVLLPRIATLYKEQKKNEMNKYWQIALDYLFLLSMPLLVGCVICSTQFVPLFYGEGYEPVGTLLKILSILFVVLGAGQIFGTLLTAIDKQKKATIAVSCGALANIILNLVLINKFNAAGACIASVIAELIVTCMQVHFLWKEFDFSYIITSFIKYLFPSVIMGIGIYAFGQFKVPGWIGLGAQIIIGIIIYFSILVIMRDRMLNELLTRIKSKYRK